MRHIKRIDELFDTEELKSQFEIEYLSGNLDIKSLVKSISDDSGSFQKVEYTKFEKIFQTISFKYSFFMASVNQFKRSKVVENQPNTFSFIFIKDNYYISFSIKEVAKDRYDSAIVLKNIRTHSTEYVLGLDNFVQGKMAVEYIHTVNIFLVMKFIEDRMIPLMKYLKFDDYLNYTNSDIKKKMN